MSQRLRRFRRSRNLTFKAAALKIGVPVTTYRDWEYGKEIRGEPYLKIAMALEVSLTELVTGEKAATEKIFEQIRRAKEELDKCVELARQLP